MKKIFWILVLGALASGTMALGISHAANGETLSTTR